RTPRHDAKHRVLTGACKPARSLHNWSDVRIKKPRHVLPLRCGGTLGICGLQEWFRPPRQFASNAVPEQNGRLLKITPACHSHCKDNCDAAEAQDIFDP